MLEQRAGFGQREGICFGGLGVVAPLQQLLLFQLWRQGAQGIKFGFETGGNGEERHKRG